MPRELSPRIGLGTVQWGMPYGVANHSGRPTRDEIKRLLDLASHAGIDTLDTAPAYGVAEAEIGCLRGADDFDIVTKTIPYAPGGNAESRLQELTSSFEQSLERLKRAKVRGLLVHHPDELLEPHGGALWARMDALRSAMRVEQLGVSVYDVGQLERLLDRFPIEIVQLPMSAFDQRFLVSGMLAKLKRMGVEVHVRSAFLQGLMLMRPELLPPQLAGAGRVLSRWLEFLAANGLTPIEGAMMFFRRRIEVDRVIIGCESADQLRSIIDAARRPEREIPDFSSFHLDDLSIVDPRHWNLNS